MEPRNSFQIFWVVQLAAYVIAVNAPDPTWSLRGIPAAQAALLGIWLAVGPIRSTTRVAGTVFFVGIIAVVAFRLTLEPDFGGWLGIENGWELLLYLVRLSVVGGFFWFAFLRRGYGLTTSGEPLTDGLLRFRLRHFFLLTTFVALYFVVHRSLDSGVLYRVMLVVFILFLGALYATAPLLTSLAILEPRRTARRNLAYLGGILIVAALIATQNYDSMSNWLMVGRTLLQLLVEVAWLAASLVMLRRRGLRLAKLPATATDNRELNPASPRAEYLRLAAKALCIIVTLLAVWSAWSVYCVEVRQQLRSQIDGRSTPSGMMVFITQADGRADASRETKNRIAPYVSQFFGHSQPRRNRLQPHHERPPLDPPPLARRQRRGLDPGRRQPRHPAPPPRLPGSPDRDPSSANPDRAAKHFQHDATMSVPIVTSPAGVVELFFDPQQRVADACEKFGRSFGG